MLNRVQRASPLGLAGMGGVGLALLANLTVVVWPAGWATIGLAAAATVLLAREPLLGWIPGGLLVALAIPFGRGADLAPLTLGGVPLHPHDAIIGIAVLGPMVALARGRVRPSSGLRAPAGQTLLLATVVFAAVGLAAMGWGLMEGQALRDILRDARWWFLYLMAPLALLAGVERSALLRALLVGTALFAVAIVATLALPQLPGGLKEAAVQADSGAIRMQYGNSIFLVAAVAYLVAAAMRRTRWTALVLLALAFGGLVLALTRISIVVAAVMALALVGWAIARAGRELLPGRGVVAAHGAGVIATMALAAVGAVALITAATFAAVPEGGRQPTAPLQRLLFGEEGSDLDAIIGSAGTGGRLATYLNAFEIIRDSPATGGGLGQQVEVDFATRPGRVETPGLQPGVDNAYLTAGVKAGVPGIAALGAWLLLPLLAALGRQSPAPRPGAWFVAAWLGIGVLTLTQSFAVSGYAPFGIALLAALPFIAPDPPPRDMMPA